jgi:hypothetical protein
MAAAPLGGRLPLLGPPPRQAVLVGAHGRARVPGVEFGVDDGCGLPVTRGFGAVQTAGKLRYTALNCAELL